MPMAPDEIGPIASPDVQRKLEQMDREMDHPPRTLGAAVLVLQRLVRSAGDFAGSLTQRNDPELRWWAAALERCCRDQLDDLAFLAPWTMLPAPEPAWRQSPGAPLHAQSDLRAARPAGGPGRSADAAKRRALEHTLLPRLDQIVASLPPGDEGPAKAAGEFLARLRSAIKDAADRAVERIGMLQADAQRCAERADMDFAFLLDKNNGLFAIGYNASDHRLDASFYDLLASEARLASFVAIAQGQVAQEHWFALGRLLTRSRGEPALLTWSGSMFEYLMPLLVMPTYENTLLDQTCKSVVQRQIEYGRQRGVPWGISESGYNNTDAAMNYQYRAFGVPGLGSEARIGRGSGHRAVCVRHGADGGAARRPARICSVSPPRPDGRATGSTKLSTTRPAGCRRADRSAIVRSFMAHHQGMSLLSLAYVLLDRPMQRRFEAEPLFKATDLLLQERIPEPPPPVFPHAAEAGASARRFGRN